MEGEARYLPENVFRDIGAYNSYYFMLSVNILESIMFFTTIFAILLVIKDVYFANTDLSLENIGANEGKRMTRQFYIGSVLTCVFTLISCAGSLFYVCGLPYIAKMEIFAMSNVIRMISNIIFIFVFWYFAGYVKGCIKQHCKSNLY